jgi:hypothetical protein
MRVLIQLIWESLFKVTDFANFLPLFEFLAQEEAEKWQDLTNSIIHTFSESNKTYSLGTSQFNQTVCDTLLEIDEVAAAKGETSVEIDEITAEKNLQTLSI